jgi:hypothetical protein
LGGKPGEVHGNGAIGGETQVVIPVAPIFNECDVGMALSCGSSHTAMIPSLWNKGIHGKKMGFSIELGSGQSNRLAC